VPGNIIDNMPPQADDPARKQRNAERAAREQAAAKTGQAMQIGAGGIKVTDGGSITIQGSGALHVGSGALDSAGSITAATDITAGGTLSGANISTDGTVSAGAVATGNVNASGQVSSALPLKSVGTFGYLVANNFQSVWQDGETFQLGYSPSSTVVKTELTPITAADVQKLLELTAYWGRYIWDAEDVPPRVFLLAADVQAAGFGPDVAPVVTGGDPLVMIGTDGQPILDADGNQCTVPAGEAYTINYSQLVVPLLAAAKAQQAEIAALSARLDAAGIA
jgi:hypothetical protein